MKILIIGGSHAGIAACQILKSLNAEAEVTLIEKGNVLGFIPSTINLIFQKMISPNDLDLGETGNFEALVQAGVDVLLNTQATKIDVQAKVVSTISTLNEEVLNLSYDYLILATGSESFAIQTSEEDNPTNQLLTTYKQKEQTKSALTQLKNNQDIGIIGAGLIGLELASSLSKNDQKKITIIEQMDQPLFRYFDKDITTILLLHLPKNVQILFRETLTNIVSTGQKLEIELFTGKKLEVDTCIYAINPKPEVSLVRDIIELDFDSTILVDSHMRTSVPNIYAIGDLVKIPLSSTKYQAYLPLIGNARKTAFIVANDILLRNPLPLPPSQRTIGTEIFGLFLGSTGLTKSEADFYGLETFEVKKSYDSFSKYHQPQEFQLTMKLLYDSESKNLLGAQLITSRRDILDLINILSQLITNKKSAQDLIFVDIFFSPQLCPTQNFLADMGLESLKAFMKMTD